MLYYCFYRVLLINIELKTSVVRYEGIEQKTCDLVKSYHLEKYIVYSSFLPQSVDLIKKIDPTALADEQNMWSVYAEEMGYGF